VLRFIKVALSTWLLFISLDNHDVSLSFDVKTKIRQYDKKWLSDSIPKTSCGHYYVELIKFRRKMYHRIAPHKRRSGSIEKSLDNGGKLYTSNRTSHQQRLKPTILALSLYGFSKTRSIDRHGRPAWSENLLLYGSQSSQWLDATPGKYRPFATIQCHQWP
jgi:hypothetical protein